MKELSIRALSGAIYVLLLIASLYNQHTLTVLLAVFGILSLAEFSKLINLKMKLEIKEKVVHKSERVKSVEEQKKNKSSNSLFLF